MASIVWIPVLFGCASLYLYFLAANLPGQQGADGEDTGEYSSTLKFPSNLVELNELASLLLHYTDDHLAYVVLLFCSAYIYKQTFAIPGSIFMNLLAGALFGVMYGFPLACVLSATGATCCYALSNFFGKHYILHHFSGKITPLSTKIRDHRQNLFFYLLSLRLFPVAPNWLMNMAAPVLDVPVHLFFFSVFFGLMPYNFLSVEAGGLLSEITSTGDIFTTATTLKLLTAACVVILPAILMKRFGSTEKERTGNELTEKECMEKERSEKEHTDKEHKERERAENGCTEKERTGNELTEKECMEKEHLEKERMGKEHKERERTENGCTEKECTGNELMKKELMEKECMEKEHSEKEHTEKERTDKEHKERERTGKELTEKECMEKERSKKEHTDKEHKERERTENGCTEKERTGDELVEKELTEKDRAEKERTENGCTGKEHTEKERTDSRETV